MKTAIYTRVSTTEQAKEGYSLASQKHKLLNYCNARDWTVVEIYSDEGISASSIKDRPQATRMLQDAKNGLFENILILKVDRLCRNTRDLLEVIDLLKKCDVRLNAVDEQIDYTTPTGKMMLTLLGSFAELERSTIAERMKTGREQKVRVGIKSKTGKVLYGYEYVDGQYVINEEQAKVVRLIYDKIISGESLRGVARYLSDNKIKYSNDSNWIATTVRRLIINPTYKGYTFTSLYKHNEGKYYDFGSAILQEAKNVEPIVSEETYELANNIINSRKGNNVRKYARSDFYFADVAYCNCCGWKLYARNAKGYKDGQRRLYYRCHYNNLNLLKSGDELSCNFTSIENSVLEELFLNYLESLELNISKADNPKDKKDDAYTVEKENLISRKELLKSRKDKLLEKYLDNLIEDDMYTSMSANLNDELDQIDERLKDVYEDEKKDVAIYNNYTMLRSFLNSYNTSFRDIWKTLSDDEKRIFVTSFIKKIYVARGKIVSIQFN